MILYSKRVACLCGKRKGYWGVPGSDTWDRCSKCREPGMVERYPAGLIPPRPGFESRSRNYGARGMVPPPGGSASVRPEPVPAQRPNPSKR